MSKSGNFFNRIVCWCDKGDKIYDLWWMGVSRCGTYLFV